MAPHVSQRARTPVRMQTLLVAENNDSMRARLVHELGQHDPDLAVLEARTAAAAAALLSDSAPDTVVLDASLPDRDGLDLALALRRGGFAGRLVLLTTDRSDAAVAAASEAGAAVLTKPFTRLDVARALTTEPTVGRDEIATRPGVLLPSVAQVRSLLAELLHAEPEVALGAPVLPRLRTPASVALYVRSRLETGAVLVADTRMSLWLAGSLGLVPSHALAALLEQRSWPASLDEDLHEAADMLRSLFTLPSTPALRLYAVHRPGRVLDPLLARAVTAVQSRLDLVVSTPDHGPAGLSLVVPRT